MFNYTKKWMENSKNVIEKNAKFAKLLAKETKNPFKKMALILSDKISNLGNWLDYVHFQYVDKQKNIIPRYDEIWDSVYKKD